MLLEERVRTRGRFGRRSWRVFGRTYDSLNVVLEERLRLEALLEERLRLDLCFGRTSRILGVVT